MIFPALHTTASCAFLSILLTLAAHAEPAREPLKAKSATASSEQGANKAANAIDGLIADHSRWLSQESSDPSWLEIDLGATHNLAGVHLFSGYGNEAPINDFELQFDQDGKWVTIPSAVVTGNNSTALKVAFDATIDIETSKLRLWITKTHQNVARVKEIVIWPGEAGDVPPLPRARDAERDPNSLTCEIPYTEITPLYLNQSGFNTGKPKRFTAPTLDDGTPFEVRAVGTTEALFSGEIQGRMGDFTAFEPGDDREYVVAAGDLVSVPFRIGPFWLERTLYQNSIDFMIDSRHYVGNDRNVCRGSYAWRDDHHFAWVLHTLVPQYISNPSAYERMPRQVSYEAQLPGDPKRWGALEPYDESAPDIVKLIHWGADVIVTKKLSHEHLKAQLAYFLYAWPAFEKWLPKQNYEAVSAYAFEQWDNPEKRDNYPHDESPEQNLLAIKTKIGETKGGYPPGFSVEPNLLMYQVALRDNRPDAERYFKAAYNQVEWMIANLDWNDPQVTKGQRISEFLTMTGMAHLLRKYPDRAPAGLHRKIQEWADVMIRRSNNMWDFRRLDDASGWVPTGPRRQHWNEPGNVVGFPATLLAAREFISPEMHPRIDELVWSHFDNMAGRNPVGRHFGFRAYDEVMGVKFGWFSRYPGGIGRLRDARFVLDGAPKQQHYPHNPQIGNIGWTEGWIQHNAPLNLSLAYLAWSESKLDLKREGGDVAITLRAPLNFDYSTPETATVTVQFGAASNTERVTLTETGPSTGVFTGRTRIPPGASEVRASHGFGYLGTHSTLKP